MYKLNMYIYDPHKRNEFFSLLLGYLSKEKMEELIIDKSWQGGYSIQIMSDNLKTLRKIEGFFKLKVKPRSLTQYEVEKQKILSRKLSFMEETEPIMDVFSEGESIVSEVNREQIEKKYKFDYNSIISSLRARTNYMLKSSGLWAEKTEAERYYYCLGLAYIIADTYPEGALYGSFSYRSNFEYYKKQLELLNISEDKRKKYFGYLNNSSDHEVEAENLFVYNFLDSKDYLNDYIFESFIEYINYCYSIFSDGFKENEKFYGELYTASTFFERVSNPSEFHNMAYTDEKIIKLYNERQFIIHRYMLAQLYSLFPLLGIKNIKKQKVLGKVTELLEERNGVNWLEKLRGKFNGV
ncbi:hypothetical protein ABH965_004601 [Bacillus sp. RC97]|uniref:hypothetical protein n=1 Tax=Bacillus sp. RC97 TaxID=3156294 RepID=UPI003836DC79